MVTLVIGGAASGKSEYAEQLALSRKGCPRIYLATMQPSDSECLARIEKHRLMRAKKNFTTIECYTDLASVVLPPNHVVLLECIGNLCANEWFNGCGEDPEAVIWKGVLSLQRQCEHLIVVSNDVGSGGSQYAGDTISYLRLLGHINQKIAALADIVCEVACGIPIYHKGGTK